MNIKTIEEGLKAFRKAKPAVKINTGVDIETQNFFAKKDSILKK